MSRGSGGWPGRRVVLRARVRCARVVNAAKKSNKINRTSRSSNGGRKTVRPPAKTANSSMVSIAAGASIRLSMLCALMPV